jgi:DNA ligase-1
MAIISVLESLAATSSRLEKEEILEQNHGNDHLKRVLIAALDPYVDYGVRKFKKPKAVTPEVSDYEDLVFHTIVPTILDQLATRKLSGNAARDAVTGAMTKMDSRQQKWFERILLKNLRIGVQTTTVNKVWPGLIKVFKVQLATTLQTSSNNGKIVINDVVAYPKRVEPKLDGLRCIAIKRNGVVTLCTRNGTVLETLPKIKETLESAPYDNAVLDGEAMGDDWNESTSVLMSSKTKKDDSKIFYNVFDAMTLYDWVNQENNDAYSERCKLVNAIIDSLPPDSPVRPVEGKTVENEKELMEFYASVMNKGYEGIMLKDMRAPYRFKRSDAIMKMKPVITYEGVVVGHYDGRYGTSRHGQFGGFEAVLPNGIVTRVGGGFNDVMRAEIKVNADSYIGKIIEIEGQPDPMTDDGLTVDGKVRFPVFLRFRDHGDVDQSVIKAGEEYLSAKEKT